MTELELYKFIHDNNIEWHKYENDERRDVLILPKFRELIDLCSLLSPSIFDDEGIECRIKQGYVAIWMNDICDHYGIDIDKVFTP